MKKYLIDASIIGGSLCDFRDRFCFSDCILVMSDKTLFELEKTKKKDLGECDKVSRIFVRFLIDYFARNVNMTEVFTLDANSSHIDRDLVDYARIHNWAIITADKGMALYARIKQVEYVLIEPRYSKEFKFYKHNQGKVFVNVFDLKSDDAIFVNSTQFKSPDSYGNIQICEGNHILHMHSSNSYGICEVDEYIFTHNSFEFFKTVGFNTKTEIYENDDKVYERLYRRWKKRKSYKNF